MTSSSIQNPMSHPAPSPSPPLVEATTSGAGGVRRYHTISAHGRSGRNAPRPISEESSDHPAAPEDEYINPGEEWVAPGVGAVGEKNASLHRQASLPTKYHSHRGYQTQSRPSGPSTPLRTMNSLSVIQAEHGLDGDGEEDWEAEMRGLRNSEAETLGSSQPMSGQEESPISPSFEVPSPPTASGAGVRRHQSLTYGASQSSGANLRRHGTLAGVKPRRNNTIGLDSPSASGVPVSPTTPDNEEQFVEEEYEPEEEPVQSMPSIQQPQPQGYASSPGGRSPWSTPGPPEWRGAPGFGGSAYMPGNPSASVMDDVQRALSTLELNSSGPSPRGGQQMLQMNNMQGMAQPPRFSNQNNMAQRGPNMGARSADMSQVQQNATAALQQQGSFATNSYVAPIGSPQQQSGNRAPGGMGMLGNRSTMDQMQGNADDMGSAQQGGMWDAREGTIPRRTSNPNLQQQNWTNLGAQPPVPSIPQQYLPQQQQQAQPPQHQQAPRLAAINYSSGIPQQVGPNAGQQPNSAGSTGYVSPIDVPTLIATKGYNPTTFDIRPNFARYFVIKSYTEDDVHKSLKYEIWSSTDPGNKRLDKAFKEVNGRGPIYLFFSVNASGHFCGMAEMLTAVDYTRSSTVWASDKWKGVFKVRWIFVRDIPNANLRHIRLNNTQERKPVTNSRDTQELLPEAGHEMLRIFFTHPARTSLLQDFAYYELQSVQKPGSSAPQPSPSPPQTQGSQSPQQNLSPATQNPGIYSVSQPIANSMPVLQGQYLQSVMRNPSPAPPGNYGGVGNVAGNYSVQ